jgi:uncharacterized membrane protein YccC
MTAVVVLTAEMAELAAACEVLDAARARHEAATVGLREAVRELENARSRKLRAVTALEDSCRTVRAALPTLAEDAGA